MENKYPIIIEKKGVENLFNVQGNMVSIVEKITKLKSE